MESHLVTAFESSPLQEMLVQINPAVPLKPPFFMRVPDTRIF